MNFLQLEYFIELVKQNSFSKAAEKLGISQAALSLSHSKLEKEIGYPLLEHHKRAIVLTPHGKEFYKFSLSFTHEMNNIYSEFEEAKGIYNKKTVNLGISHSQYHANWLSNIYDIYPDMRLNILQMSQRQIQEDLLNGSLDFGIVSGTKTLPPLNRYLLSSQPFELLVLASSPLANRNTIGLDTLSKVPLVALFPSANEHRMIDILSKELNFTPNIVFEGSSTIMTELFHEGFGGIITCAHDKRQYMRYPPKYYHSLEVLGTNIRYEYYLQWAEHCYLTKYNRLFRDYVLDYYHLL